MLKQITQFNEMVGLVVQRTVSLGEKGYYWDSADPSPQCPNYAVVFSDANDPSHLVAFALFCHEDFTFTRRCLSRSRPEPQWEMALNLGIVTLDEHEKAKHEHVQRRQSEIRENAAYDISRSMRDHPNLFRWAVEGHYVCTMNYRSIKPSAIVIIPHNEVVEGPGCREKLLRLLMDRGIPDSKIHWI